MNSKSNETQQLPKPPRMQNRFPKATATTGAKYRLLHSKIPSLYDLKAPEIWVKRCNFPSRGHCINTLCCSPWIWGWERGGWSVQPRSSGAVGPSRTPISHSSQTIKHENRLVNEAVDDIDVQQALRWQHPINCHLRETQIDSTHFS